MMGSLFRGNCSDFFAAIHRKLLQDIDKIPNSEIEHADSDDVARQYSERYQATCPKLVLNEVKYDEPEFTGRSDRILVSVYVPFTGDSSLFQCSGGSAPVLHESIHVEQTQLIIQMPIERQWISEFSGTVRALLNRIEEGLASVRHYVTVANPQIKGVAKQRIDERQYELNQHKKTISDLKQSGFKIRRRDDEIDKVLIPVKPKPIALSPKPTPALPEPELALNDYDDILGVIRSMVSVYERSPSVFKEMGEEELRTILLVGLNGMYKGNATGETFNGVGKTDILIRVNDKNIFIAECLIWSGPEHFKKKLTDQLFKYATWRDSKLAVLVFNRNKDFSSVVEKMKFVVAGLSNKVADLPVNEATTCRHRLRRDDDSQKEFILTCMAFEVPS